MIRTKQEIKQAVAILEHKADSLSMVMAEVLQEGMTEQQVFQKYVMDVADADRDESVFFAARDAARFRAGHIGLEELIPDAQSMNAADFNAAGALGIVDEENDTILLSRKDFNKLLARIKRLEKQVGFLCEKYEKELVYYQSPNLEKDDFMIQEDAFKYIGCSKATINSWTKKGFVKGYRKGTRVYYSKSELDSNPTVQNFRHLK